MITTLLIPGILIVSSICYTYIRYLDVSKKIDVDYERTRYAIYKQELLRDDFQLLDTWMNGKSIDAFTAGSVPASVEAVRKFFTNFLKDIAYSAIGIRVTRVETDCFWVLSGTDLHFFSTNVEGELDKHFQFDNFRIEEAKLQLKKISKDSLKGFKTSEKSMRRLYAITFNVDGVPLTLEIRDRLNYQAKPLYGLNVKKQLLSSVKYLVVGEQFIEILQDKFPQLKLTYEHHFKIFQLL